MATKTKKFSISKELSKLSIDDDVTINFDGHSSSMMKSIYSAYKEGRYCDVSLCVDDKKIFCHSLVLSGISDYFKALFEMDGKNTNEFILYDVDFSHLEKIVEFAYTGKLNVHVEEIESLMISANFFHILPIQNLCEAHLLKSASSENCTDYLLFAYTYGFEGLQQFCMQLYGEHFEVMCDREKISMLPFNLLQRIMNDDDLVVLRENFPILLSERELVLLRAALQYINETVEGKQHSNEILECVRFPQIPFSDVIREIEKWPQLKPMTEVRKVLKLLESGKEIDYPIQWTNARIFPKLTSKKYPSIICPGYGQIFNSMDTQKLGIATCEDIPMTDCIKSIIFFLRTWFNDILVIGGLIVEYDSGIKREYGGKAGPETFVQEDVLQLNKGEMITVVEGCTGWLVDRLVFETSAGRRFGPFGGPGGEDDFSTAAWNDKRTMYLHGFTGTNIETQDEPAVVDLGLIWKYYERKSTSACITQNK